MQTSLIINAAASDGTVTKTVTDVNSEASGGVCYEYGRLLNATTTNTFQGVNRVDKESLDVTKTTPTLTVGTGSVAGSAIVTYCNTNKTPYLVDITYDGDGKLSVDLLSHQPGSAMAVALITANNKLALYYDSAKNQDLDFDAAGEFTVRASETDTCNAVSATFNITV